MSKKGSITTADYLPFSDYQKLVQTLINEGQYWWSAYCILSFCTGLRVSDIRRIRWNDLLNKRNITITEKKTGKTRLIPLGANASDHLSKLYEKMGSPKVTTLVVGSAKDKRKAVSSQYINRILKTWPEKYGLDIGNFSTHTFRKTFGRYVYEKSGRTEESLLYLNRIFKHSNIETTMVYLGIRNDEIAGIFNSIDI